MHQLKWFLVGSIAALAAVELVHLKRENNEMRQDLKTALEVAERISDTNAQCLAALADMRGHWESAIKPTKETGRVASWP